MSPERHARLRGWAGLSLASLGLAACFALLLAAARTPFAMDLLPADWEASFQRVLVSHVVLSSVIWCLAAIATLATLVAGEAGTSRWGLPLAAAGTAMILVPTLAGEGAASINDYVPVLVHPLYYGGLALFAAGISAVVGALLWSGLWSVQPFALAIAVAGAATLAALLCFAITLLRLPPDLDTEAYHGLLTWGGGHVLQFAYTAAALAGWHALAGSATDRAPLPAGLLAASLLILLFFALAGPVTALSLDPLSAEHREAFTLMMRWGLAAPPVVMAFGIARLPWRRTSLASPAGVAVMLSLALFGAGGILGFFASGGDTRTPAHYHASLGGVNLALMGLFWVVVLPALARPWASPRAMRLQLVTFALGQALFAAGMFAAGANGVPRKTPGLAQGLDGTGEVAAMALAGLGGLLSVLGGLAFVVLALPTLLSSGPARAFRWRVLGGKL